MRSIAKTTLAAGIAAGLLLIPAVEPASAMTNGILQTTAPPWMALVITNIGGLVEEPDCSATVVGNGWVLTAAHCVYDGTTPLKPRNLRVLVGRADRHASNQGAAYGISSISIMPGYVPNATHDNDAALIQLQDFDQNR